MADNGALYVRVDREYALFEELNYEYSKGAGVRIQRKVWFR